MTSFLSEYLELFLNLTLPGFFYLLGVLVLVQAYTKIKIFKTVKKNKEFLLYISILVVVFSFIIGLVVYLAEQEVKTLFIKSLDNEHSKLSEADKKSFNNMYCVLIMIRHLLISISFLVISIAIYFIRTKKRLNNKRFFTFIYTLMFLILSLAYFKIKYLLDNLSKDKPICWLWILGTILMFFSISLIGICSANSCKKR